MSRVLRDHHNLRRNLSLNDNWISNDGGDEGIKINDAGRVSIGNSITDIGSQFEVFNTNVQLDAGSTGYQASSVFTDSNGGFLTAHIGSRLIFDDGTDVGVIISYINANLFGVSTIQSVCCVGDQRAFKIYYPSVGIETNADSTLLRIGSLTLSQDEIDLFVGGDFTVDTGAGDVKFSPGGGNVTIEDMSNTIFDFNAAEPSLTIYDDADGDGDRDYCKIAVGANGATTITTNDDAGAGAASLNFNPKGNLSFSPTYSGAYVGIGGDYLFITPVTKASSGTQDTSVFIQETLNLSSGAGGGDIHYGIYYNQIQTNLAGWNYIYLMYLKGGGNAFVVDKDALLSITATGTAKAITDIITVTNDVNAADMDGTGSAIKFNQYYYDGSSPATEDSARIVVATESDWTSTAGTRDSYMSFFNSKNGALQEKLKIASDEVSIAIEDGDVDGFRLTNGGNISHGFYAESGAESVFTMYELGGDSNNDYFRILTAEHGATIISTLDVAGSAADLTLDPDGDINLNALADVNIPANIGLTFGDDGEKIEGDGTDLTITSSRHLSLVTGTDAGSIYLDSGTGIVHFRDEQDNDDLFKITVAKDTGATTLETISAAADGHLSIVADGHVEFDNCAVGCDKLSGTFGTSAVLLNPGDSTDIDFRLSNKYELELTNNIDGLLASEFLNLIFPSTSGNFILTIGQDGTGNRVVHSSAWTVYQSDGSTKATNAAFANGIDGLVRWAGGTAPTLTTTANKADVIAVYWDADNQTAFAVASLNF